MIKVENLTKIYKSKNKSECKALDNISFVLPDKGMVFICGKSGSGKSTLLNLLGGLDCKTFGSISVYGNEITKYNDNKLISYRSSMVGFIFQDFHLLDDLTVEENVGISLKLQRNFDKQKVKKVLKQVDLEGYEHRYPNELSGGQKQRVAIARALVKNPNIILADEPTGNLDSNTTRQIIELLKEISKDKLVIIVSHNLYDAYEYADRIIELSNGKILNNLELNKDYSNKIKVEDNKVIFPLLKRFDDNELDILLKECKKDNITKLEQDKNKYINYKEKEYIEIHKSIKKAELAGKDNLRFSYLFGKKSFFSFLLSSILSSLMIVVLALSQSIAYFDDGRIIQEELSKNTSVYSIRKEIDGTLGESNLKEIEDYEIEEFKQNGVDVYKLYNDCLYFNEGAENTVIKNLVQHLPIGTIFTNSTFGTLETTKEYAQKILKIEELNIFTNDIEYKDYGVYITDYMADCALRCAFADSYADLLGEVIEDNMYYWGYINGIIITDYKTKYALLINQIVNYDETKEVTNEMVDFYDYLLQALGMSFTFEKDFEKISLKSKNKSWAWSYEFKLDGKKTEDIKHVSIASYYGRELVDNEAIMYYETYNKIFKTDYAAATIDQFVPHTAFLEIYDEYGKCTIKKEINIISIEKSLRGSRIHFSDSLMEEHRSKVMTCFALYFDGEDLSDVVNLAVSNNYISNSVKMSAVQTMSNAVSVFNTFFDLIVFILIVTVLLIIISFGVKNIKSNMYEIGVLKAIGFSFKEFVTMFMLHTLVIIVLVVSFSYIGYYALSGIANKILLEALRSLTPSYVVIDLNFINFDYLLMAYNSLVVCFIAIISTLIPIGMLKRIEPITIIKAKE